MDRLVDDFDNRLSAVRLGYSSRDRDQLQRRSAERIRADRDTIAILCRRPAQRKM